MFDGNGIEVDVLLKPTLEDFTTGSDSVLGRAIALVSEKAGVTQPAAGGPRGRP
jgi:hypothetical protein